MVTEEDTVYRRLQEHLDKQAVGFPKTDSGAEIRFLSKLFSPDEARLALYLSYTPTTTEIIVLAASPEFVQEQVKRLLDSMQAKGAISWKEKEGKDYWCSLPMIVGMYEGQDGRVDPELMTEALSYLQASRMRAFLTAMPSQMRTIPLGISIPVTHNIASYDQIGALVEASTGPFIVLPFICRETAAWREHPCKKTNRSETCLGFGEMALGVLRRKHGREILKKEVLSILRQNEADGLVLQPSNAQNPSFVCSCCGCCCGMLTMQKQLRHPVDFWTSSFQAVVDETFCTSCGTCVKRCQVNAIILSSQKNKAEVNLNRCIGCGLCAATCTSHAIRLEKKSVTSIPPENEEELYNRIMSRKRHR
jgi:Pyruvate/2-oxoacid:ferredoxin oxidoreductase delta subunit